ncbi:GNAT family N-acetyltransferase [Vibrio sp. WXL103]|uniref:GNAT family N-acetyltransferase n=1 Tax=Vibrio sp. WXL103 TaxID=3450710 RepID=UPI003EC5F212
MQIEVAFVEQLEQTEVIELYRANHWSSAEVPTKLLLGLQNSDALVVARLGDRLVGLGNAISDGHLVVYYPHLLVHPDYQGQGIGRKIMQLMQIRYRSFHQQMLTADKAAVAFYQTLGFERAGETEPMWIYAGDDH